MTFAITENKTLKLSNVNGRKEHHGEQLVQAVDLAVHGNFPNTVLALFHGALLAALFGRAGPAANDDVQREIDLPVSELPNMRFSKLKYPLKWDFEIEGATLSIFYGTRAPIVLSMCKVKDFQITPLEGGTVELAFKVSTNADITEKVLGKLGIMSGTDIEVTLIPPVVEDEQKPPTERASGGPQRTIEDQADEETPTTTAEASPRPNGKNPDPGWPFGDEKAAPGTPEAALAASMGLQS